MSKLWLPKLSICLRYSSPHPRSKFLGGETHIRITLLQFYSQSISRPSSKFEEIWEELTNFFSNIFDIFSGIFYSHFYCYGKPRKGNRASKNLSKSSFKWKSPFATSISRRGNRDINANKKFCWIGRIRWRAMKAIPHTLYHLIILYFLEQVNEEQLFYIVSPKDIIIARVSWLCFYKWVNTHK